MRKQYKILRDSSVAANRLIGELSEIGEYQRQFIDGTDDRYAQWLAAGNTPDPADPSPDPSMIPPSVEERLQAAETLINLILDEGEV